MRWLLLLGLVLPWTAGAQDMGDVPPGQVPIDDVWCTVCHYQEGDEFALSVHYQRGLLLCDDCHGGDPLEPDPEMAKAPDTGFIGKPARADIADICARREVTAHIENHGESVGCTCSPWIMDQLEAAVVDEGIPPRRLFSGAGHDAQAMAELTDVGMLFLRCDAGVSHNPDEAINGADAGTGVRVMLRFLRGFTKQNSLD